MGKATVDLPDPLDKASGGADNSADDLLSQLAGDEIDRLLAQAEVEKTDDAPPGSEDAAPAEVMENASREVNERPPEPTISADAANFVDAPVESPSLATEDIQSDLSTQLDALFDELSTTPTGKSSSKSAPATEEVVPAAAEAATTNEDVATKPEPIVAPALPELLPKADAAPLAPASVSAPVEGETSHAEREALTPAAGHDELLDPAAMLEKPAEAQDAALPAIFRPLQWINAPISMFPAPVREALGKVAILTLVNAIAVLAYVLLFRKH